MNTTIQTPDFKADKTLLNFILDHTQKIELLNARIVECRVCLRLDKSDERKNKICEVKVFLPGYSFFVCKQCHSFEEAMAKAMLAIKHHISRWKESFDKEVIKNFLITEEKTEPDQSHFSN
jgi:putative sigma-54 modulation protein